MGTNFYARIIPTHERKKEMCAAIEANDAEKVVQLAREMYGDIYWDYDSGEIKGGRVHLGKGSYGWKFLWNCNIFQVRNGHVEWTDNANGGRTGMWVKEPDTAEYVYPLTKEGIKAFIDRDDVEVYDEYGERQVKDAFFRCAVEWTTYKEYQTGEEREAWDADSYHRERPDERVFSSRNEYTDFLESLGYKLSEYKADFYSDGLRFSTHTEFS